MFVKINSRGVEDWDLMGTIGHELRHTIEVIDVPTVTNEGARYFLYQQIGQGTASGDPETRAAVDAGNVIRDEVRNRIR